MKKTDKEVGLDYFSKKKHHPQSFRIMGDADRFLFQRDAVMPSLR